MALESESITPRCPDQWQPIGPVALLSCKLARQKKSIGQIAIGNWQKSNQRSALSIQPTKTLFGPIRLTTEIEAGHENEYPKEKLFFRRHFFVCPHSMATGGGAVAVHSQTCARKEC
jgi:hypothetical protein